jgi:hypothetical protein
VAATERESDLDYLRAVELLAQEVVEEAAAEGWLAFGDEGQKATVPLHRAINQLATRLRMVHFEGDGCVECLDAEDIETK